MRKSFKSYAQWVQPPKAHKQQKQIIQFIKGPAQGMGMGMGMAIIVCGWGVVAAGAETMIRPETLYHSLRCIIVCGMVVLRDPKLLPPPFIVARALSMGSSPKFSISAPLPPLCVEGLRHDFARESLSTFPIIEYFSNH